MRPQDAAARLAAESGTARRTRSAKGAPAVRGEEAIAFIKDLKDAVKAKLGQSPGASVKEIASAIAADGGAGNDGEIVSMLKKKVSSILVQWKKTGKATGEGHGTDWKWTLVPSGQEGN